jgi:uncharacterized protein YheU (UPF0270 family)
MRLAEVPLGPAVVVPHERLTREALRSLAEEFVTREGTDYGLVERSFEAKVQTLLRQIANGEAVIVYDGASDSTHVVRRDRTLASPTSA